MFINRGKDIVDCFARYFSNGYDNNLTMPASSNNSAQVNLHSCLLSITDGLTEFDFITNKTTPDPDIISNRFFAECKFILAIPLTYLFNQSLFIGSFPFYRKISNITPIKKIYPTDWSTFIPNF